MRIGKPILAVALALAFGFAVHVAAQEPAQTPQNPQAPAPGAEPGRGGRGGFRPPRMYEQQMRKLAPPAVIAQGKALFGVNCSSCHGADLRGGEGGGPNLLISQIVLSDQHGELITPIVHGARQAEGMPALDLSDAQIRDIAAYIHSVAAGVGSQGRPPGESDTVKPSQILVGDPVAGKAYFDAHCTSCHSITGDLVGIGSKYSNPVTLQNTWVSGEAGGGRGFFGRGPAGKPATVTVTLANGKTLEGNVVEVNDFVVTLTEADGTRVSLARNANVKSVVVHQPNEAHMNMVLTLTDEDMHNVTAYLATIK